MMIIKPEGVPESCFKFKGAEDVRLWVINHINDFCIRVCDQQSNWEHKATDHEGILAERTKERRWAEIKDPEKGKFQVYFSTVPLPASLDDICNGLGTQNDKPLIAEIRENIPRPYPDDPFFIRLNKRDWPPDFLRELKKICPNDSPVSYVLDKSWLRSEPKMPLEIKDQLLSLKKPTRQYKLAIQKLYANSQELTFLKIWMMQIPSPAFTQLISMKKLFYWEAVMYRDSTSRELNEFRELERKKLFTTESLKELKELLRQMIGRRLQFFYPGSSREVSHYLKTPWLVYERRSVPENEMCGLPLSVATSGPVWVISTNEITESSSIPKENEDKTSGEKSTEPEKPPPDAKAGTEIFQMMKNPPKFTLPFCNEKFFPPIDDPIIDMVEKKLADNNYVRNLYQKKITEKVLWAFIQSVLEEGYDNNVSLTVKKWREDKVPKKICEFLSCFFYIGEAKSYQGAIMMALEGAIRHMENRTEVLMKDIMSFKADPIMKIEKDLIVGFGTGCDGFSESPNPKHVYSQLSEWWATLNDEDKSEIKSSYEIEVIGYSSPFGESKRVNLELRQNRAWKIAHSLKMILEANKAKASVELKELKLKEGQTPPQNPPYSDPAKPPERISLYFYGEPKNIYPIKDLTTLYAPMGATLCDVLDESSLAKNAVSQIDPDNDPRDRIGWVIFRRSELRKNCQFVSEKGVYNAAAPVAGYRFLWKASGVVRNDTTRALVYVIPAFWKENEDKSE